MIKGTGLHSPSDAFFGQRPDPTAEHLNLTILIYHAGKQHINIIALKKGNCLGDYTLLSLHLGKFSFDQFAKLICFSH